MLFSIEQIGESNFYFFEDNYKRKGQRYVKFKDKKKNCFDMYWDNVVLSPYFSYCASRRRF